jgi:membrane-bound serine protease (ClpP class)
VKSRALRGFLAAFVAAAVVPAAHAATPPAPAAKPRVLAVKFDNDVNPVTADYVIDQIHRANNEHYNAVAILLDTPGGLSDAMKDINKAELASKIPVVVYVSPEGARAASAGVWIGQAADILAMAPQTNIGSSTPINVGGENIQSDLRRKVVNDAAASLRALAQAHGRNVHWADAAVRRASNLSAREALRMNVIDVIAPTLPALLNKIDGTKTVPKGFVMHTANAEVTNVDMSLWKRILDLLVDPNIIALMLSIGLLGIVVELWNPGLIFPGTVGAISLIVGLFGLQVLPISAAGLLLMILAAAFFAAELFVPSHGALTLAGGVCFFIGSLMLFDPAGSAYQVSTGVALAFAITLGLLFAWAAAKVWQVRRTRPQTGQEELVGQVGVVRTALDPEGYVHVHGELWRARSENGPIPAGTAIEVTHIDDGLVLDVRPLAQPAPAGA